jgi:hypothetical protein
MVPSLVTVDPVFNATEPVPNAASLPTRSVPAFTVTPPLNVLVPVTVIVPVPAFVSNPLPDTTPPNTTAAFAVTVNPYVCKFNAPSVTALATVTVEFAETDPAPLKVSGPLLAKLPNVVEPPITYALVKLRAEVELLDTTPPAKVSVPVPNAALSPTSTVPAFTVTPPLNVFAPESVSEPELAFTKAPVPVITPL